MNNIKQPPTWISRTDADEIVSTIKKSAEKLEDRVHLFLIDGDPGIGKTVVARLVGQEFNSSDGYEIGKKGKNDGVRSKCKIIC